MTQLQIPPAALPARNGFIPHPLPAQGGERAIHELIDHRVDEDGNRLPWSYPQVVSLVDEVPFKDTPLHAGVANLRAEHPFAVAVLEHYYDHRLLEARKQAATVLQEERADQASQYRFARKRNKKLTKRIRRVEDQAEAATQPYCIALEELDQPLQQAHEAAADQLGKLNVVYDPQTTTAETLLNVEPRSDRAISADAGLPWVDADKEVHLHPVADFLGTMIIGTVMGVSVGIISGILRADTLARNLGEAAACAVFGIAAAYYGKHAVQLSSQRPSERYYLGHKVPNWLPFVVAAVLFLLVIIKIDATVELHGLLNFAGGEARLQALSGGDGNVKDLQASAYAYVSLIATIGYFVTYSWLGYLKGRKNVVVNRVERQRVDEHTAALTAIKEHPEFPAACSALARVSLLRTQQETLKDRIEQIAAPYQARIQQLESLRLPEDPDLNDKARMRHLNARDAMRSAQHEFDTMLAATAELASPSSGGIAQSLRSLDRNEVAAAPKASRTPRRKWQLRWPRITW